MSLGHLFAEKGSRWNLCCTLCGVGARDPLAKEPCPKASPVVAEPPCKIEHLGNPGNTKYCATHDVSFNMDECPRGTDWPQEDGGIVRVSTGAGATEPTRLPDNVLSLDALENISSQYMPDEMRQLHLSALHYARAVKRASPVPSDTPDALDLADDLRDFAAAMPTTNDKWRLLCDAADMLDRLHQRKPRRMRSGQRPSPAGQCRCGAVLGADEGDGATKCADCLGLQTHGELPNE